MNYAIDIPRWVNVRELADEMGVSHMAIYRARNGIGSEEMIDRVRRAVEAKKKEAQEQPAPAGA